MIILSEIAGKRGETDWQEHEKLWIQYYRDLGYNLVNSTDGGDGVINLPEESAKRIRMAWVGRKHKPESIEKMRIRRKNQVRSEPSKRRVSSKMKERSITWGDKLKKACSKFSPETILEVQDKLSKGALVKDLAKEYDVHRTTISKIKKGTYENQPRSNRNWQKVIDMFSIEELRNIWGLLENKKETFITVAKIYKTNRTNISVLHKYLKQNITHLNNEGNKNTYVQ